MFSFKYAIGCMLAGLLAGYSFDKKKSDMVWVGIFTYLAIFSVFYISFPYDSSWAFVALIEVLAGHGLYKMGFGNFLSELFSGSELKKKTNKVITAAKAAKDAYVVTSAKEVHVEKKPVITDVSKKPLLKEFGISQKDLGIYKEVDFNRKLYVFLGSLGLSLLISFIVFYPEHWLFPVPWVLSIVWLISSPIARYFVINSNPKYKKAKEYQERLWAYNQQKDEL